MKLVSEIKEESIEEVRGIKQQKLDREYVGKFNVKKGLVLYAMCMKTYQVYEVKKHLVKSKVAKVDFSNGKVTNQAEVEEFIFIKGDPILWALNEKNAIRKFQKMIDDWYNNK